MNKARQIVRQLLEEDVKPLKVKQGTREERYEICPHCNQEILEKHIYLGEDGFFHHSDCGGPFESKPPDLSQVPGWLRPYCEKARDPEFRKEMMRTNWDERQRVEMERKL